MTINEIYQAYLDASPQERLTEAIEASNVVLSYLNSQTDPETASIAYLMLIGSYVGADGAVTYYGVLEAAKAGKNTLTLDVNGKLSDGDKLYVFNEQVNGDKKTDYSSALVDVAEVFIPVCRIGDTYYATIGEAIDDVTADLMRETRIWDVVYDSIVGYDEKKMEEVTRSVANRELRGVTLWGGVIGFGVGFFGSLLIHFLRLM